MQLMFPLETYTEKHRYKYLALYHAIRDAIHGGMLTGGTRLPSSRWLAGQYGLSRGSVAEAYEMLRADGYIRSDVGRGTFISAEITPSSLEARAEGAAILLSPWGERLLQMSRASRSPFPYLDREQGMNHQELISFGIERMPEDHFPMAAWNRALRAAARELGTENERDPAGDRELREVLARHLQQSRGIRADAEQLVLFSGSMQSIALLAQLLVHPGRQVITEDPGYQGIVRAVTASGGQISAARLDDKGIIPADWDASLLFVTPARQFPSGTVLSLARRRELLAWASRRQAVIVEDNYDSELRWGGRPMEPLKALDTEERVITIGSFSKTMYAGFRLGYAVLPRSLMQPVITAKALYDPLPPGLLEQRALARFMAHGDYARHLRRITRLYGARCICLQQALNRQVGGLFDLQPSDAGLHLYARWLGPPDQYAAFRQAAVRHGVSFRDAGEFALADIPPAACFGFAHLEEEQIEEGARRLAAAWKSLQ
ncbi:PLP-dependent aminotransferase family protein [Paenibacillus sp. JX-17]|uniref:PLP-dependent aminotransferase family protein n=1 Tax=Paenibacillus lacisoli TaxID=3064525 RepID=A0ABT9CEF6_9BACL|nr:PLP-dependent aminotransferase family protein [Paenibacillus sp. JX-17]MDO7907014.1 PLP-dependent aminotransferase family protein [Paenibacillus sp. JX-17]